VNLEGRCITTVVTGTNAKKMMISVKYHLSWSPV